MSTTSSERPILLVLRALGLGDFLAGVPALRALANAYPHHRLILASPRVLGPLATLTEAVDTIVDTAPLAPVNHSVRGAAVAVNLHGRGPESHRVLLATRPKALISFANPGVPQSADGPNWYEHEHEVRRWCRLLEAYDIPANSGHLDIKPPPVLVPEAARGATLIHPGAASPARRWPADRWSALARYEAASGRPVVFTGRSDEVELARRVARDAGLPDSSVYAGRTDLSELAALVAAAGRVVCGDTGVAHLATALRTPSVVLFGPTSPKEWGPPPERPWHRSLWTGNAGDPHASSPDPGLLEINVSDVIEALADLPEARLSGEVGTR